MFGGHYSIIQYQPDVDRAEGINVGVVLISEAIDRPIVEINLDFRRVKFAFSDAHISADAFRRTLHSLAVRLRAAHVRTRDQLIEFIGREAGTVTLLPPRATVIGDPMKTIGDLVDRLVAERRDGPSRLHAPDLDLYLKPLVMASVPIETQSDVTVPVLGPKRFPYAFRNGSMNYLEPWAFQMNAIEAAKKLALLGHMLHLQMDGEIHRKLIVVGSFKRDRDIAPVAELLHACSARLVLGDDLPGFAEEIRRQAHT